MVSNKRDRKGAVMSQKRKTLREKKDRKVFTQTANSMKKINIKPKLSRGGIRL